MKPSKVLIIGSGPIVIGQAAEALSSPSPNTAERKLNEIN